MKKARQLNLNVIKTGIKQVKIVKWKLRPVSKQSIEIVNQIETIIYNNRQLILSINWNQYAQKLKLQKANLIKTIKKTYQLVSF